MKLHIPSNFKRVGTSVNPLLLSNINGNGIQIHSIDHHIVQVIHTLPNAQYSESRISAKLLDVQVSCSDDMIVLKTNVLTITITLEDLTLSWSDINGNIWLSDLKHRAYEYDLHAGVNHYTNHKPSTKYYGLGERGSPLDLNGRSFKLACTDALGYDPQKSDPLYKHFPFFIAMDDCKAYGIYYDSYCQGSIDFGCEIDAIWGDFTAYKNLTANVLSYYVMYGPQISSVVEGFASIAGKPALIPKYALGMH